MSGQIHKNCCDQMRLRFSGRECSLHPHLQGQKNGFKRNQSRQVSGKRNGVFLRLSTRTRNTACGFTEKIRMIVV